MALDFGTIATEPDGTGVVIDLGEVHGMETLLGNANFNKSLPGTTSDEKINFNIFGTTRKIKITGTVTGTNTVTFVAQLNTWYGERSSGGRYLRTKFDDSPKRYVIETARIPEEYATDIINNYELVLIQGTN